MHTDIILGTNPTEGNVEGNVKGQSVMAPSKTSAAEEEPRPDVSWYREQRYAIKNVLPRFQDEFSAFF